MSNPNISQCTHMPMIDYSDFNQTLDCIENHKGILILNTQDTENAENFNTRDALYGNIFKKIDAYIELPKENNILMDYKVVLIGGGIDQILLYKYKHKILEFLQKGGIVLNFAPMYLEWMPVESLYIASKSPIKDRIICAQEHFIMRGVRDYDITYRRGVCGFFSRGYILAPKHAEIFLKDSDERCIGYIDTHTTNGIIINTAGADLLGYGLFEQSTAKRMGLNLLQWIADMLKQRCL